MSSPESEPLTDSSPPSSRQSSVLYADNGDPVFVIVDGRQWAINTPTAQAILHTIENGNSDPDDEEEEEEETLQELFPLVNPERAKEDARKADEIEHRHIKQQQKSSSVMNVSTLGKIVNVGVIIFAILLYTGIGWGVVLAGPLKLQAYICASGGGGGDGSSNSNGESLNLINVDHGCLCPGT